MTDQLTHDTIAMSRGVRFDSSRNVANMVSDLRLLQALEEALLGNLNKLNDLGRYLSDQEGSRRIAVEPLNDGSAVNADDVAVL